MKKNESGKRVTNLMIGKRNQEGNASDVIVGS
jgi:hypothetical protein